MAQDKIKVQYSPNANGWQITEWERPDGSTYITAGKPYNKLTEQQKVIARTQGNIELRFAEEAIQDIENQQEDMF
jgi:hypothetical protein